MTELPKLSAPAKRALDSINVKSLEDLTQFTEKEISELHGVGASTIKPLKKLMEENNLKYKNG